MLRSAAHQHGQEHEREHKWTAELVSCTFRMHLMDLHVRRAAVSALLSAGSEDIVPPSRAWALPWLGRGPGGAVGCNGGGSYI